MLRITMKTSGLIFYESLRNEFPFPVVDHEKAVHNKAFEAARGESLDNCFMSQLDSRVASAGYTEYPTVSKKK